MKISDVMTHEVFALAHDTGLNSAVELFERKGISGAPVIHSDGTPCGIVTVTDIASRDEKDFRHRAGFSIFYRLAEGEALAFGGDTEDTLVGRVEDVMTMELITVDAAASLQQAGAKMLEHSVHRVLVLEDGKLVGIVSTLDLIRAYQGGGTPPSVD